MRIYLDIDPANANTTGYKSNATGASWPLTATTPGDGLAHFVTVKGDAATDHSAKTAILTGTDANGIAQTETINLPNGTATVVSTKHFATLTSVVPSATIGADTMDIGWSNVAVSWDFPLDTEASTLPTFQTVVTGTVNYDIEVTAAPREYFTNQGDAPWVNDTHWGGKTATTYAAIALRGVRGRVYLNSWTDTAEIQFYGVYPTIT